MAVRLLEAGVAALLQVVSTAASREEALRQDAAPPSGLRALCCAGVRGAACAAAQTCDARRARGRRRREDRLLRQGQQGHALHERDEDLPPVRLLEHGRADPERHRRRLRNVHFLYQVFRKVIEFEICGVQGIAFIDKFPIPFSNEQMARLFKAKILKLATGIDFRYNSSYAVMNYQSILDVSNANNLGLISSSRTNLDAFVNFGIERFNFYFRYENISYFWEDKLRPVVEGYPIAPPRMRIGITWEFLN